MNLFMMCARPNEAAFRAVRPPFFIRACRPDETGLWTRLCTESAEDIACAQEYIDRVYRPADPDFHRHILFACGEDGRPVGACMLWKAYGCMETIHWLRVLPEYEGNGLGRALLSACLADAKGPVFLHTQEHNLRAIGLYHSLGFRFLTDPVIGHRQNHYADALPLLRARLPENILSETVCAPSLLLEAALSKPEPEF